MTTFNSHLIFGGMVAFTVSAVLMACRASRDREILTKKAEGADSPVDVCLQGDKALEVDHLPKGDPSTALITVWLC